MRDLESLRREIDAVDAELLRILNRRAALVHEVAAWKSFHHAPIRDPERERFVLDRIAKLNRGPLSESEAREIMAVLVREFRNLERRVPLPDSRQNVTRSVGILGVGLMGGSLALALSRYGERYRIIGYDPKICGSRRFIPEKLPAPLRRAVRYWAKSPEEALRADIVVLALPVKGIRNFLVQHGKSIRPGTIVLDLGSTKREICETARKVLPRTVRFFGGHPLAGKARAGAEGAESGLFAGKPFILISGPAGRGSRQASGIIQNLVRDLGAIPVTSPRLNPETHDRILAFTSHLPQMIAVALAMTVDRSLARCGPLLHGPALSDMTRLALSDYEMWRDIVMTNTKSIDGAMGDFIQALSRLRSALKKKDFENEFRLARRFRERKISTEEGPAK